MAELEEPRGRHRLGLAADDVHCAAASRAWTAVTPEERNEEPP
jgi:hypothetical protein